MKIRFRIKVGQPGELGEIMGSLAVSSCWFEAEPLPDNEWYITVKQENEGWFRERFNRILLEVVAF